MDENNSLKQDACKPPYHLGVALSGGGSRGLAHAGALKALEEAGIKPDIMAGVSAGSVVAVLYSAGVSPDNILRLFTHRRFTDFAEISPGRLGLLRIDRFTNYISRVVSRYKRLEELPIPVYIGVTNFDDGIAEEFHEGDLSSIMTASCSIPIAIHPVEINGKTYVDGGVLANLPAWTIRDKCEYLIGVNVSPAVNKHYSNSIVGVAMRTYSLMAKSNQKKDMDLCDLLVLTREISSHKVFSLKELTSVFETGYENMKTALRESDFLSRLTTTQN